MKFDLLEPFKEYLYQNLTANTAKTYYAAVVKLFQSLQMEDIRNVSREWMLEEAAKRFRTRNEFSAVKNGLKWLAKFYPEFDIPKEEEFKSISSRKRNFSKRPKKVIYLHPTQRKINQIRNHKLKYAYRLGSISGLRVSELADLEAKDFTIQNGCIYVKVQHGKGGHGGMVECRQDKYLYERLPDFLKKCPEGKVFYSAAHMQKEAKRLGFECHDLRRIFAIETRKELKTEMPVEKANEIVQQRLRHTRFSVTKRYLFNRKLKFEYEKEPKHEHKQGYEIKEVQQKHPKVNTEIQNIYITELNRERYGAISHKIISDEVILTPNRQQHIIERRGQEFFDKYAPRFKEIIDNPDYIFKDDKPNTALVTKKIMEDNKYINIILRLVVPEDDKNYKNSIITVIGENDKRFQRYLNSHSPIYFKE